LSQPHGTKDIAEKHGVDAHAFLTQYIFTSRVAAVKRTGDTPPALHYAKQAGFENTPERAGLSPLDRLFCQICSSFTPSLAHWQRLLCAECSLRRIAQVCSDRNTESARRALLADAAQSDNDG